VLIQNNILDKTGIYEVNKGLFYFSTELLVELGAGRGRASYWEGTRIIHFIYIIFKF
jgi:hypothetical protein